MLKRGLLEGSCVGLGSLRRFAGVAAAAVLCASALSGCAAGESAGPVAATVNGEPVYEADITEYIEAYRAANGYEDAAAWEEYLEGSGRDAEGLREHLIRYNAEMIMLKQDAENLGLDLPTEAEIEAAKDAQREEYEQQAEYYSGRYGVNDWETYFGQIFVNEDNFTRALEIDLIEDAHRDKVLEGVTIEEDRYVAFLGEYGHFYDANRISRITFDSEEDAVEAVAQLRGGTLTWGDAVATCSDDEDAADEGLVGWTILKSDEFTPQAYFVVASMEAGEFSDAMQNAEGGYDVFYCTETFVAPRSASEVVVADIPQEIRDSLYERFLDDVYREHLDTVYSSGKVEISPMPAGLSYDTASGASASDGSSSEGEGA